jgi:hypothetical protein
MAVALSRFVLRLGFVALCAAVSAGCKSRNNRGDLYPPDDAVAWEDRFAVAFDDDYTDADLELQGRAPHDVHDQRLFAARLGYSDIVALATVEQVWGRGRYEGRRFQYLDIELGDVLLGELPKSTRPSQMIRLRGEQDVPTDLQGREVVLFLRWAPGGDPPYHHHLMPANDDIVDYVRALVAHAREEGALDERPGKKGKRRGRKGKRRAETAPDDAPPE